MSRAQVNAICAALPGAAVSDPWGGGHDCWKVSGKMFANVGALGEGVDVKCIDVETARLLIDVGVAQRSRYLHASWVRVPFGAATSADDLRHRIVTSYRLVRAGLTRKAQAALGDPPDA